MVTSAEVTNFDVGKLFALNLKRSQRLMEPARLPSSCDD